MWPWEDGLCPMDGGAGHPGCPESCERHNYRAAKIFGTPGMNMKEACWVVSAVRKLPD